MVAEKREKSVNYKQKSVYYRQKYGYLKQNNAKKSGSGSKAEIPVYSRENRDGWQVCNEHQVALYAPLKALTLLSTNMSSDFSSAVQKLSKRILKKSKIVIFFLLLSSSSSSSVRLTREP